MRTNSFRVSVLFLALGIGFSAAIFLPGSGMFQIRTLCVYFQERQFINGLFRDGGTQNMCVKCDAGRFQSTSMACTGQSEVPSNTTQAQAFCLITNCLQQVPQQRGKAMPLGRKKREADSGFIPCTNTLIQEETNKLKVTSGNE